VGDPNLFFMNLNSLLYENAKRANLSQSVGRGRYGLWYDWDRDGRLDFVQLNAPRMDQNGKNILLRQGEGGTFSVVQDGVRWPSDYYDGSQLLVASVPPGISSRALMMSLRETSSATPIGGSPPALEPFLAASALLKAADFNGDGHVDLFRHGWATVPRELCHIPAKTGKSVAFVFPKSYTDKNAAILTFSMEGKGTLAFASRYNLKLWRGLSKDAESFGSLKLDSSDPSLRGVPETFPTGNGMHVGYVVEQGIWQIRVLGSWPRNWLLWVKPDLRDASVKHSLPRCKRTNNTSNELFLWTETGYRNSSESWHVPTKVVCPTALPGDYDNDMDMDVYLGCSTKNEDLENLMLWNMGNDHFETSRIEADQVGDGPGFQAFTIVPHQLAATADFNNDGFLDVIHTPGILYFFDERLEGVPLRLLQNEGNDNNWIQVQLKGTRSNRDGIGAILVLDVGGIVQVRAQTGGFDAFSQSSKRIHFGLAKNGVADRLTVYWDSGTTQTIRNLAANQILQVREPRPN
jgi:hypothetical protein